MLAKANTEVVSEKIDLMLNIGLGSIGKVSYTYIYITEKEEKRNRNNNDSR